MFPLLLGGAALALIILGSYEALQAGTTQYNFARKSGQRITWGADYQALKDITGTCIACRAATLLNPKFCNVNIVAGEGCPGSHIHVYKFHQDVNCFCRIQPDDPDIVCLTNAYAGPPAGLHFPLTTSVPANPELAICTGGWFQT